MNQEKQSAMSALTEKYDKDKITIETELRELKEQSMIAQNEIDAFGANDFLPDLTIKSDSKQTMLNIFSDF